MLSKCQFHRESLERMKLPPQNWGWQRQQECRRQKEARILTPNLRRWNWSWSAWDNSRSSSGGGWNNSSRTNFLFSIVTFSKQRKNKNAKMQQTKTPKWGVPKKPTLRLWPYKLHPFRAIDPCELPNHWITKTHHFSQHLNFKPHLNLLRVSEIWCLIFTSRLKMRTTNISSSWLRNFCPTKLTESFTSCLVVILSMSSGKRVRKLRNLMLLSLCARSSCVNLHKTDRKARWNVLKSVSFRHMFTR